MGNTNNFDFTGKLKRLFLILIGLGVAAVVVGVLINPEIGAQRLWANFLVNTIFFLGIGLLGLFFVATHTMAFGGWHVLIRRIPEALSTFIPVGVALLLVVVLGAVRRARRVSRSRGGLNEGRVHNRAGRGRHLLGRRNCWRYWHRDRPIPILLRPIGSIAGPRPHNRPPRTDGWQS